MSKFTNFILGALIGGLVGSLIALLFAPGSGAETRQKIMEAGNKIRLEVSEAMDAKRQELEAELSVLRKG